jgi:hypothetical protein
VEGFYKNLGIMGGFLLLYVAGAGKYSIDAGRWSRRTLFPPRPRIEAAVSKARHLGRYPVDPYRE